MTVTIEGFRDRFPEFDGVADARVQLALDDALPELSAPRWGGLYDRGVYNLAAHLLKLGTAATAGTSTESSVPVASRTVGDVSVSFAGGGAVDLDAGAYNATPYGREYFRLRKLIRGGAIALA